MLQVDAPDWEDQLWLVAGGDGHYTSRLFVPCPLGLFSDPVSPTSPLFLPCSASCSLVTLPCGQQLFPESPFPYVSAVSWPSILFVCSCPALQSQAFASSSTAPHASEALTLRKGVSVLRCVHGESLEGHPHWLIFVPQSQSMVASGS